MTRKLPTKERFSSSIKAIIITALIFLALIIALLFPILPQILTPPCIAPTSLHIARMHWIESGGEMGWGREIEKAANHLIACRENKEHLAQQMLKDSSGTVVSLGMDLIVRELIENGDALLRQRLNDKRWNFNLALNDEYARFLLIVWKMKKELPLSAEEEEELDGWSSGYFEKLGVISPKDKFI